MLELVVQDHLSGKTWRPKNVMSKHLLHHLIGKDHIDERSIAKLEMLANIHGIDISYV